MTWGVAFGLGFPLPEGQLGLAARAQRAAALHGALVARGLDELTLGRLRTPAGKVRGVTQEEIALLALAEVVMARQKRTPGHVKHHAPAAGFGTAQRLRTHVRPLTAHPT